MQQPNDHPLAKWRRALGPVEYALAANDTLDDDLSPRAVTVPGEISTAELRDKLARRDDFLLVMAMDRARFRQAHLPGSIDGDELLEIIPTLAREAEIVVYCTHDGCPASRLAASMLREAGFTNVRRYAGGLNEWTAAGLPITSADMVGAA